MDEFNNRLINSRNLFDSYFLPKIKSYLVSNSVKRVGEAALYSLEAGGKRIRPIIAINSYYANAIIESSATRSPLLNSLLLIASSLECLHTYSLIHDDLPSMDNDDLRRGLPTCHKKFDEVTAILAGDALNSFGFYLLSEMEVSSQILKDCISILHEGVGFPGMIAGQMEDLIEEGKTKRIESNQENNSIEKLYSIHNKKTGSLIIASFLLGNRLREDFAEREADIRSYGKDIGLLFQITDDILDVEGEANIIGKTPGKDHISGKLTFPSLYGLEKTKKLRDDIRDQAIELAMKLENNQNSFFLGFPRYLAQRKN